MNRFQLKRQFAVIGSINNMPFVILNWTCPPKSYQLHSCNEYLGFMWPDTTSILPNLNLFKLDWIDLLNWIGRFLQHVNNLIDGNYIPNDSKFDKLCGFQNLPHGADFQVTGSSKCHTRRQPIHHHTARVGGDFSVWDFHRKIHTNGFTYMR